MKICAYAKVNIFLKITGHKDGYHSLISRFMLVDSLCDVIEFAPYACESFTIKGCDGIARNDNSIYKAFVALSDYTGNLDLINFFYTHKVRVTKKIPSGAGLGGGSSDAGAFMRLANRVCHLGLNDDELAKIGSKVGADVPFFIYNYKSANVSGFGEIVEVFNEEPLELEIMTPKIHCDTTQVYKSFKANFLNKIEPDGYKKWLYMPSKEILQNNSSILEVNDLYKSARLLYPQLQNYAKEGWFFSGSGSSFFRVVE
ncbi:MAG: 4-(cytidine 5'-diphospho)-2-C-methyl-D-erythritol kinase [Sulfurovum sp.]|nr:MAG: 4-(cytidine 5'-diphospho)-2-C-methyl-D-erythritol kinase [Sulfurovum sp.]